MNAASSVMPGLSRHPPRGLLFGRRELLPCVYILASAFNGTLYTGVTSNLVGCLVQHREGRLAGFTRRYGVLRLVWYETGDSMEGAIAHEKRIKTWPREYKLNLIERDNPHSEDLAVGPGLPPLPRT